MPFNIACGRCRNCHEGKTGICLNVNPDRPGSAYGYVDMGGWVGGQSEWVMIPYADFNCLKFPDPDQAREKLRDLTLLSDIFPTGFHGAVTAGVGPGSTVHVAGAGSGAGSGAASTTGSGTDSGAASTGAGGSSATTGSGAATSSTTGSSAGSGATCTSSA